VVAGTSTLSWVVDADVANYFDSLDRRILLGLVRQRLQEVPLLRLIAQLLESGACATAETAALVEEGRGGGALLRRGGLALQRVFAGGRAAPPFPPPLPEMDDYTADAWERPSGTGWLGLGHADPVRSFGALLPAERSPVNTLWSLYLLAQPLSGVARQLWPHLRRLGAQHGAFENRGAEQQSSHDEYVGSSHGEVP